MHEAPATNACTRVAARRPGNGVIEIVSSASSSRPSFSLSTPTNASPAFATAWSSSNATANREGLCRVVIEKVPSSSGEFVVSQLKFYLMEAPFSCMVRPQVATSTVDPG